MASLTKRNLKQQQHMDSIHQHLKNTIKITDDYITYIRPLSHPKCNFILISKKGYQLLRLSDAMRKLVFDAIGKYIHPTRYRQIIETESCETLDTTEQEWISEDQKHSSHAAKIHYWKKRSRDVVLKGQQCLKKLKGQEGEIEEKQLMSLVIEDDEDASDPDDIFITESRIKDAKQSDDSSTFSVP